MGDSETQRASNSFGSCVCADSAFKSHSAQPPAEQSEFSQEVIKITRPSDAPKDVLQILRRNEYVLNCLQFLRQEDEAPDEIPSSWFVASEIHLGGPKEVDFVVQPRELGRVPAENRCLFGARVIPFWVFRNTPKGFELILEVHEHDLTVLSTRSKGYRDIETWSSTAITQTTWLYKFDGRRYVPFKRKDTE